MATPIQLTVSLKAGPVKIEYESEEGDELNHITVADFCREIMELLEYVGDPGSPPPPSLLVRTAPDGPIVTTILNNPDGTVSFPNENLIVGTDMMNERGDQWPSEHYKTDGQTVEQPPLPLDDDDEEGVIPEGEKVGSFHTPKKEPVSVPDDGPAPFRPRSDDPGAAELRKFMDD